MNIRAVIFDIYDTLLEVGPPPPDAPQRWEHLWQVTFGHSARLSLPAFAAACDPLIAREHAEARAAGVLHPEVYWPGLATAVLPELARLPAVDRDGFLFQQAQLRHAVRLMPGAAEGLLEMSSRKMLLGLASNSQPYTLHELDDALANAGLTRALFTPALCFFSFEHGFGKPDPHVFRYCTARLRALEVQPAQTLMVGDRLENDILPAQNQGFHTWQLTPASAPTPSQAGDWKSLAEWVRRHHTNAAW